MKRPKMVKVYDITAPTLQKRVQVSVLAWAGSYLCVTPSLVGNVSRGDGRFAVTHVGSGGAVCYCEHLEDAVRIARRLAKFSGWSWRSKTAEEAFQKTKAMRFRKAIGEVIKGGVR